MRRTSLRTLIIAGYCLLAALCAHAEVLTSPAAIISSGSLTPMGSGRVEAYWGNTLVAGDIKLRSRQFDVDEGVTPSLDLDAQPGAATGAGLDYPFASGLSGKEKWLRWQCSGSLLVTPSEILFPPAGINGVPVTDFFTQLLNGSFAGFSSANTNLSGGYTPLTVDSAEGILYDPPSAGVYTTGTGALVQGWAPIATGINDYIATNLDYAAWKQAAIDFGSYVRPNAINPSGFVDANGNTLYVELSTISDAPNVLTTESLGNWPLTDLTQISMKPMVPMDGNTYGIPDRVLFVDTVQGTAGGDRCMIEFDGGSDFFWKGMIYVMGDLQTNGMFGSPAVRMKNPDEFAADPTELSTGTNIDRCFLDGMLVVAGTAIRHVGPATIYGSYVTMTGNLTESTPAVYYNSRLTTEGIALPQYGEFISVQSGYWWDKFTWGGVGVPDSGSSVTISPGHTVAFSGRVSELRSLTNYGQLQASGEIGFRNGPYASYGLSIFPSDFVMRFRGQCSIAAEGFNPNWMGKLILQDDGAPTTCTISGDVDATELEIRNVHADFGDTMLLVENLIMKGASSVQGGNVHYFNAATLTYQYGDFTVGDEWRTEDEATALPPSVVNVMGGATVTLDVAAGKSYWVETVGVAGNLFAPGSGTLKINDTLDNYGHLHVTGDIFDGFGSGPAPIFHGLPSAITTTRTVSTPGSIDFGYCDLDMDFASIGSVGSVAVTRHYDAHPSAPWSIASTGVYWDLQANGSGFDVSLKLPHSGVSNPYVCRYSGVGDSWIPNRSRFDASSVELDVVTEFSTWAVGDASLGPVPVSLSGWSAD